MQYVSADEVIDTAASVIATATEQDKALMLQWLWEGLQQLGVSEDQIQVCTLIPKNCIAKKPADLRILLDISLYDSQGLLIPHVFRSGKKRIYPIQSPTNVVISDGTITPLWVDISQDLYNIILGSNAADTVAAVGIRYFAYPLDPQGRPMVRQDEVMALIYFLRFFWSLRKNDNRSEIDQNRNMWLLECDRTIAKKKMVPQEELKTIARAWRSLIPNLNNNQF